MRHFLSFSFILSIFIFISSHFFYTHVSTRKTTEQRRRSLKKGTKKEEEK